MVDEKTKQDVIEIIKNRTFFRSKRVAKKLNISGHMVSYVFRGMEKEGLIKKWSARQWRWVER